jgi:hypothetical protein
MCQQALSIKGKQGERNTFAYLVSATEIWATQRPPHSQKAIADMPQICKEHSTCFPDTADHRIAAKLVRRRAHQLMLAVYQPEPPASPAPQASSPPAVAAVVAASSVAPQPPPPASPPTAPPSPAESPSAAGLLQRCENVSSSVSVNAFKILNLRLWCDRTVDSSGTGSWNSPEA